MTYGFMVRKPGVTCKQKGTGLPWSGAVDRVRLRGEFGCNPIAET